MRGSRLLVAVLAPLAVAAAASWPTTASASARADRDCKDFKNQAAAQAFFLDAGGPGSDRHDLDSNSDGLACEENRAPFRGLIEIAEDDGALAGTLSAVKKSCARKRAVKLFTVAPGKDPVVASLKSDQAGSFELAAELMPPAAATVYAKLKRKGKKCVAERSADLELTGAGVLERLEIVPAGMLLTHAGDTEQLSASGFDHLGNPVDVGAIEWTSSDPLAVSVGSGGIATAQVSSGSAQITATAQGAGGEVESAPGLATVTAPAAGALLLTDANVVSAPVATDPDAEPSFENTFEVVLTGLSPPAVGTLLINTETIPLIGRVEAVTDLGSGQFRVTLSQVGLSDAFPALSIDQELDLSDAPVEVDPELLETYDVERSGNTFSFTPKPGAARQLRRGGPSGTHALPPFTDCEFEGPNLPLRLDVPPTFSVSFDPTLDLQSSAANGLEKLSVKLKPQLSVEAGIKVQAAFEGKVTCKLELFAFRAPIGGPLSAILSGLIPVGVGFEAAGKLNVADFGIGGKVTATGTAEIGLACPPVRASCGPIGSVNFNPPTFEPQLNGPSIGDVRLEPSLQLFAYAEGAVGNPFLSSLRLTAAELVAGPKLEGSFATKSSQLAATDYKSSYKLSLELAAKLGDDLEGLASLLATESFSEIEIFKISTDLAKSPTAATLTADRSSFQTGDDVEFTTTLSDLNFLGIYNVKKVVLVRQSGGQIQEVGSVNASPGQSQFTFNFTAPNSGAVSDFHAFVVTNLVPIDLFSLELAKAQGSNAYNLKANLTEAQDPASDGDVTYSYNVENLGPSEAPSAELVIRTTPVFGLTCSSPATRTLQLGGIPANESVQASFTITCDGTGDVDVEIEAKATPAGDESAPGDNKDTERTTLSGGEFLLQSTSGLSSASSQIIHCDEAAQDSQSTDFVPPGPFLFSGQASVTYPGDPARSFCPAFTGTSSIDTSTTAKEEDGELIMELSGSGSASVASASPALITPLQNAVARSTLFVQFQVTETSTLDCLGDLAGETNDPAATRGAVSELIIRRNNQFNTFVSRQSFDFEKTLPPDNYTLSLEMQAAVSITQGNEHASQVSMDASCIVR